MSNTEIGYACHVINLARTPQRMAAFLGQNAATGLPFQRFEASDGNAISEDDAVKINLIKRGTKWRSKGVLGVALSHRRLWERTLETRQPSLVFEDDATIRQDIAAVLPGLMAGLAAWDIVLLGYNTDALLEFTLATEFQLTGQISIRQPNTAQLRKFAKARGPVGLYRLRHAFGISAYAISPEGAGKLIANCFPMDNRPIAFPHARTSMSAYSIDSMMNAHFASLNAYVAIGPLALPANDHQTSTTVGAKDKSG